MSQVSTTGRVGRNTTYRTVQPGLSVVVALKPETGNKHARPGKMLPELPELRWIQKSA